MIPKEELNIDSFVIYVNYGKNFLAKIVSEGRLVPSREELLNFEIEYNDLESVVVYTFNDMFRGVELNSKVKSFLPGLNPNGFHFDFNGTLFFKSEPYRIQPDYLHQFQSIYNNTHDRKLLIYEDRLEKYVSLLQYQEILDANMNVIKINIKEGSKGAEVFQKMKADKDVFREAVQNGKINEYAKKHPNVVDADTLHHSQ